MAYPIRDREGVPRPGYRSFVKRCEQSLAESRTQSISRKATPVQKPPRASAGDTLQRQIDQTTSLISQPVAGQLTYTGDVEGVDFTNVIVKPKMPDFLYRPMYGRPRSINIPEIRRLADSPTPGMCIQTITNEVTAVDWQIRMIDPDKTPNETAISEVEDRLKNPNRNKENLKIIFKKLIRDILCVDAGILCKIYDLASYEHANPNNKLLPLGRRRMLEFYAHDGGGFTKNPDIHGILPDQHAYYQYNFHHMAMPVPFGRDEVVYMQSNPRTNNIYGVSPMEMAYDVIRYEVFGVTSGIDHFTRNEVPKGVISILDANTNHIKEFKQRLLDKVNIQDPITEEARWVSSSIPIINQDVKFVPFQLTPEMIRLLESQQWYLKIILACFGVTPSELGFTESSTRNVEIVQSEIFKRKAVLPMLGLLEYYMNREIVPEYGFDDIMFEFQRRDVDSDIKEQSLWGSWLDKGQRTINEWRAEFGDLDPVDWGDEPMSGGGFGMSPELSGALDKFNPKQDQAGDEIDEGREVG